MKNLINTFLLLSLAALFTSCSTTSVKGPQKPSASNGKAQSKTQKSTKLSLMQQHQNHRELLVGRR